MEWKLFDLDPPEMPEKLAVRDWMNLEGQPGFTQRAEMVASLVSLIAGLRPDIRTLTDLGCGDGSMLKLFPKRLRAWGYEIGAEDVKAGLECGLDIRRADILHGRLDYGDLIVASEVLEHLADPVGFLQGLPPQLLVVSSPSLETGSWHNDIHAWAWDLEGYRDLLERAGWQVIYQTDCDGGSNVFGDGIERPQRFQAAICTLTVA